MNKYYLMAWIIGLFVVLAGIKIFEWDSERIDRARESCKIICGAVNYDCRRKCFWYEYKGY